MTPDEKLATIDTWMANLAVSARDIRSAIHNGVPPHWRQSKSLDAYKFDTQCLEFMRYGLGQLKKAVENGDA